MTDTVDRILMRYQSQDFDKVVSEQQTLAKRYADTAKAQDKVSTSGTNLQTRLNKLQTLGRNMRQAGGFLGNDTIRAAGDLADGLSDIGDSITAITKNGGRLGKALGGLLAVTGGITAGFGIYDATIGKLQGQTSANILDQFGQFAQAGFNQDQLYKNVMAKMLPELNNAAFQVKVADIKAEMATVNYSKDIQKQSTGNVINDLLVNGVSALFSGQAGFLQRGIQAGKELYDRPRREALLSTVTQAQNLWGAGQNFMQAGQLLTQRQRGAQNQYQAALYAIERETGQKRAAIARDYANDLISIDENYYKERQKAAADYGIEASRMEAEHQKDVRRMQEDHQDRLKKLAESRDALAIEDEIDSYSKERKRAEEDYTDAARMRQEDYARQMAEMERAHQEQRNARQRQYQEQLRELSQQAAIRRQQELEQYQLLMKTIIDAFVKARNDFATSVSNSNTTTTNSKTANVTNHITSNLNADSIASVINDVLVKAFN